MENQNQNVNQQSQGWKDVNITPDMPLAAVVHFLNILNHRLCNIEDNLVVTQEDGTQMSLTQIYAAQAQAEMDAQNRQETQGE